jgi:tetratricopeptide (TPR) repeat protein
MKQTLKLSKKCPIEFEPGKFFGKRYKIIAEISRGELGRIYKAKDTQMNKIVALRIFNPEMSDKEWMDIIQKLREWKKKKKTKAELSHNPEYENMTKLYNIGRIENIKYISMEYKEYKSAAKISVVSKTVLCAFATTIMILIGMVIYFALIEKNTPVPSLKGPGRKSIAVMYFENNTGDEHLDHWREALSDLLITDLAQSRYIRVLSEKQLFYILKKLDQLETTEYSLDVLQEVAKKGKVEYLLLGSLNKAGDYFRIDIKIQEAKTGELVGSELVMGEGEESIFAMVDELTKKIKLDFEFPEELIANDIDREVCQITTNSPEAYKNYIQAKKYSNIENYSLCIKSLKKALSIDPDFAMAYLGLAMVYGNMAYEAEAKKNLSKALSLANRISDRERYLIQAHAYKHSENTWDKAIKAFEKLLNLYPDDLTASNNLGILYNELEEWDKAIEKFDICIQNNDISVFPYTNKAFVYMCQGLYNKAEDVLKNYLKSFPDNTVAIRILANNYLCQGKYESALIYAEKATTIDPVYFENYELFGDMYHIMSDFKKAEKNYRKMLPLDEPISHLEGISRLAALYQSQGKYEKTETLYKQGIEKAKEIGDKWWESGFHVYIAYLYITSGKPEKALEACDKAMYLAVETDFLTVQRYALHYKALTFLEMNLIHKAEKTAQELYELIDNSLNQKKIRYYYHLMGLINLKRKNPAKAIKSLENVLSMLPFQNSDCWIAHNRHALFIDSLAKAYYQSGNLEKAQKKYERIISLTMGRLMYGDIYAKSYYMLGKIYQQKDWKGKAIENYEKFLELWKEADPNIPEIKDAKKQLSILQSNL